MTNEEIAKAIDMSDLANGELNTEQQDKFIDMVYDHTRLLKEVRHEEVDNPKGELGKMFIGEPITRDASVDPTAGEAKPKTTKVTYETKKVMSWYDLPTDVLFRNIAKEAFEDQFMAQVTKRIGNDLELLAIRGDQAAYSGDTTPMGFLLRVLNGWKYQSDSSHIFDAGGASIQKGVFARMSRALPEQYKGDSGLRWIASESIYQDWMDTVADRLTAAGDDALAGKGLAPYGIPFLRVPLIPSNLDVSILAASAGFALGTRQGPFTFTSADNAIELNIDAAGAIAFTMDIGTFTTSEVAAQINAAMGAYVAFTSGFGQLLLQSPTTGGASTVEIIAEANDCYDVLGITVGTYTGSAAAAPANVPEGSYMFLANPKNLIHIMLKKTRLFTEFKPRADTLEVTIYNEVDDIMENNDAIVKCINLRLRELI